MQITEVAKKKTNKEKSAQATNVSYTLKVFLEQEPEAIKLYQRRAGRFILATNILEEGELTPDEMLSKYKEQQSNLLKEVFALLKTLYSLLIVCFLSLLKELKLWQC